MMIRRNMNPSIQPILSAWHYSHLWALASLKRQLHSSLSPARLLQPRNPTISDASLQTKSSHPVFGVPNDHV